MTTNADVVALALTKNGFRYDTGPTRTTGQDGYFDCSGFTYFLLEHLGIRPDGWEPQSHLQALYDRDHGLIIPINQAISTVGALLYEGPQHAYVGGAGIPGHVAVSLGNGHTIEAMGHAWGTRVGSAFGRGWSNAGLFPNVTYSGTPTPPHPQPEPGQQLQGDDMALVVPSAAPIAGGRAAFCTLDVQGNNVDCFNGLKLDWDMPPDTHADPPVQFGSALVHRVPINGPLLGMTEKNGKLCVVGPDGGCAFAEFKLP